jgi:multiple sugar transport system ATP-binding protein
MGDRVAVLKDGILQQVGTPREMYDHPNNVFVAGFIGSPAMNLLQVDVDGDVLHFGGKDIRVPRQAADAVGATRSVSVGVRPEDMDTVGEGQGLATEVVVVEELGADAYVHGEAEVGGERKLVVARVDGRRPPAKGEILHLAPREGHLHMFAGDTGERIDIS